MLQTFLLEHAKGLAAESEGTTSAPQARTLERHPAQTAARTTADAPAQLISSSGAASLGVSHAHLLNRVGPDALEICACACSEIAEIEPREPLAFFVSPRRCQERGFVAEIEYPVYFDGGSTEP